MFKQKNRKFKILNMTFVTCMFILSLGMILPFLWMLSTSFKYDSNVFTIPIEWIPNPITFSNYIRVWTEEPFLLFYKNTLIIVVFGTTGQVFISSMAAYAFAKLRFMGRNIIFALFTATMMVPWQTLMIPQYQLISYLNLVDTHAALIIGQLASAFGVFLLRQFIMSIPNELRESGIVDGANEFTIFTKIIMPQAKAGVSTLVIFSFIHIWNDYLAPLIYLNSKEKFTLQLGLQFFNSEHTMQYGIVMAGTVCSLIPIFIIFLVFQKQITQGISNTGIKG